MGTISEPSHTKLSITPKDAPGANQNDLLRFRAKTKHGSETESTVRKRKCAAYVLCGGKGSRMSPLTGDSPKQLLTLDERGNLDSTLLGRLVNQLQNQPISRIVVVTGHYHEPFTEWAERQGAAGRLRVPLTVQRITDRAKNVWATTPETVGNNLQADEYALIINGDLLVRESDLRGAIHRTAGSGRCFAHGRIGESLPHNHKLIPHYDIMCWVGDKEALEAFNKEQPRRLSEWLRFISGIRHVGVSIGRPYINVNTPDSLELAREWAKRGHK